MRVLNFSYLSTVNECTFSCILLIIDSGNGMKFPASWNWNSSCCATVRYTVTFSNFYYLTNLVFYKWLFFNNKDTRILFSYANCLSHQPSSYLPFIHLNVVHIHASSSFHGSTIFTMVCSICPLCLSKYVQAITTFLLKLCLQRTQLVLSIWCTHFFVIFILSILVIPSINHNLQLCHLQPSLLSFVSATIANPYVILGLTIIL